MILVSNDPRAVVSLIRLSIASYRKMIQNLAWAAGYNIIAIPLAAGALAWAGITLPPALGAVFMSASTIVVAANAQLLRRLASGATLNRGQVFQVPGRPPVSSWIGTKCGPNDPVERCPAGAWMAVCTDAGGPGPSRSPS